MEQINYKCMDESNIIDTCYEQFKSQILNPDVRPRLDGKFIFINCNHWIDHKAEMFWHLGSLGDDEEFSDILPCNNHLAAEICNENCITKGKQIRLKNKQLRSVCLYRCMMVDYFNKVINLANNNDKSVIRWLEDNKTHLWYRECGISYIIILENKRDKYYLKTAFPVFYRGSKNKFTESYKKYLKKQKNQ